MAAQRIDSLNSDQVKRLAEWRDKWLRIGLSTEPTNRPAAEDAVRRAYQAANFDPPKIVVWLRSPLEGAIGAAMLAGMKVGGDQVWDQVWAQVWDQVWDQVRAQVGAQVGAQVRDQVWAQVWDQVRDQVWDQVWDQVRDQVRDQVYRAGYGSHDANWLGFYDYFDQVCDLNSARRLRPLGDLAQAAGWWWPFAGAFILTERPVSIHRDARNRLHHEDGPALAYSDGLVVYAWHGVRVSKDLIEHPEQITAQSIDAEQNTEIRRIMIERFGIARYVSESHAEVVHADVDPLGLPRRLLRKPQDGGIPDLMMIEMTNSTPEPDGTRKKYLECVHPELRPLPINHGDPFGAPQALTCHNAIASQFGLLGEDYQPQIET